MWCDEASGSDKPSEYFPLQAVASTLSGPQTSSSLRHKQAGGSGPGWLIRQSPEVLHSWVSAPLSQEPGCYSISTSLKGQNCRKGGEGGGWWAMGLILTSSTWGFTHGDNCLMSAFLPVFSKTMKKEWKKENSLMTLQQPWKEKGGKVNLQLTAFVLSDSHVLGGGRPARTH